MPQQLLLGDEALALGALDAGLSGCYAYPGTPSTEIMEFFQSSPEAAKAGVHREWSANEKTAMEEALGMSYAGKRAMVCMKHVGMNVCGDGFVNAAVTGSNGGLIVVAADDPSMHSSQNEQDSRYYAQFAMIPCIEPTSQQEAYQAPRLAFELSERLQTPVLIRLTTRLSHSRADIVRGEERTPQNDRHDPENPRRFVLLPGIAKVNYARLCDKQADFIRASEDSSLNQLIPGRSNAIGVVTTGIAYNYLMEAFGGDCPYPILKLAQYPLPQKQLRRLMDDCDEIYVIEEGMPFVETQLRSPLNDPSIHGRLSGDLPRTGELNPRLVAQMFHLPLPELPDASALVRNRPPRLCDGCPHISTYQALTEALKDFDDHRVFGDIGCYTLGALPPFSAISTCVDMGASITMAKGAADAGITTPVAVIGDSTFTHSGMTGLLDAIWEKAPITVVILDNGTTGMTGGQTSIGAGRLEDICAGLGADPEHIHVITPLPNQHAKNVETFKAELAFHGLSVIIARRECIQTLRRKK